MSDSVQVIQNFRLINFTTHIKISKVVYLMLTLPYNGENFIKATLTIRIE